MRESRELTVFSIWSPRASPSSMISKGGHSSELRMETGIPALLPGVKMLTSHFDLNSFTRSGDWPHELIPSFHMDAVFSACASGLIPFLVASSSLIQGRKSEPSKSGKASMRLAMSPLGSITMAGTLSMAASSRMERQSPVFPDPVIPKTTPWVTRSLES